MTGLLDELEALEARALNQLGTLQSLDQLALFKANVLGKKGELTQLLRGMGALSADERPKVGERANRVKSVLEEKLTEIENRLQGEALSKQLQVEAIDVSLPGRRSEGAALHPITQTMEEIVRIFSRLGFQVALGPEVEDEFYNFDALNIPPTHPSRDMHDTFFISDHVVLRTHTSPVQVRTMLAEKPPIRVLVPGRVYRSDYDVSHTPMFHQVEGLLVDEAVTFSDLKGSLQLFAHEFFGRQAELRFRPSYFPFTEPSAEVDVRCVLCSGNGCRACKETGWLEILGCGMVDPEVFKAVDYDPLQWFGFAFGFGVERMAMLKYGIPDLRVFFENDIRFARQFQYLKWKPWTLRLKSDSDSVPPNSNKKSEKTK